METYYPSKNYWGQGNDLSISAQPRRLVLLHLLTRPGETLSGPRAIVSCCSRFRLLLCLVVVYTGKTQPDDISAGW